MDDNGGGTGWFFDTTPLDDIEFTSIADPFQASFIDSSTAGQTHQNDFYRTIVHEIGHALGILIGDGLALNSGNWLIQNQVTSQTYQLPVDTIDNLFLGGLTYVGIDQVDPTRTQILFDPNTLQNQPFTIVNELWQYNLAGGGTITFTENGGGHFYEGPVDPNFAGAATHPNDLMNPGRTVPAGPTPPIETTRQFISDLNVRLLADVYGYTTTLPSTINTAHAMLDSIGGTLLVQGSARDFATGFGMNDTITLQRVTDGLGDDILVTVNATTERIPFAQVHDIVIHGNGGTDTVTVNVNVTQPWQQVQFVVSSNQDALETSTSVGGAATNNGIVDLSAVIPGSQTTLRAAIIEANSTTAGSARSIYVGRGHYDLTLNGTGGATQGDFDISRRVTIVGAGAGATVINAGTLTTPDRVFEVVASSASSLDLSRVTLTGGTATHGGAIRVNNNSSAGITELRLTEVAIVGNTATGLGGGVYVNLGAEAVLTSSVVTDNSAGASNGGGGIYANATTTNIGIVRLDRTVVAKNTNIGAPDLRANVSGLVQAEFYSLAGNMITDTTGANFVGGLQGSDYVNSNVQYVVTSAVDSYNHVDDGYALSIREAIDTANVAAGAQTIWLPAWDYVLTRDRTTYGSGPTDIDVSFGDLDIVDSLTIRGSGIAGNTSVAWRPGVVDKVFELVGDYDGSGTVTHEVSGSDFFVYQSQYGSGTTGVTLETFSADGDDDGDVDVNDRIVWDTYYGNVFSLLNVAV